MLTGYFIFLIITVIIKYTHQNTGGALDYSENTWPDVCHLGQKNSPIDFPVLSSTKYINSTSYFKVLSSNYTVTSGKAWIVYQGYKFVVEMDSVGYITISKNGVTFRYNLVDMHLHVHSEHTLQGVPTDMEIHLVHTKDTAWLTAQGVTNDPDPNFKYLVVGILFKKGGTTNNTMITKFDIKNLGPMQNLDISEYVKPSNNFFHYEGGLTTPTCDESVNWVVMQNIQTLSDLQFQEINNWVTEIYPSGNARSVHPLYSRTIYNALNTPLVTSNQMNFSMIIVAMAAMFIIFFFRKKFDII